MITLVKVIDNVIARSSRRPEGAEYDEAIR